MAQGPKPEDFTALAAQLGFDSELLMFLHFYDTDGHTIRAISTILGYSPSNIRRRMLKLGIELHTRGRRKTPKETPPQ